jgi:hypothetical protein
VDRLVEGMEAMEGMLEKMRLSAAEKKGIKIAKGEASRSGPAPPQAVGKVFAERLVNADGLAQALGKIWCPIKGVVCKDLGENHFLFTFLQASGKRCALDDGPWMFGKDLVVMVEYDEEKTLEELEFAFIPIWARISKMPFGMMNKATGEAIGKEMGEFLLMDKDEDNTAVGQFLRIKVRIDIRKPLMRGVTLCVGKDEKPLWCPVVYEFLPDFCYTCGIIRHIDKACSQMLKEGEVQQFSKKLRFIPERRRGDEGGRDRVGGGCLAQSWRLEGSGGRGGQWGSGSKNSSGRSGSDAPSWRKDDANKDKEKGSMKEGDGEEVTSPLKKIVQPHQSEGSGRSLFQKDNEIGEDVPASTLEVTMAQARGNSTTDNAVLPMIVDGGKEKRGEVSDKKVQKGTFKRQPRTKVGGGTEKPTVGSEVMAGRKRRGDEMMEVGDMGPGGDECEVSTKKLKFAGLADQPCKDK